MGKRVILSNVIAFVTAAAVCGLPGCGRDEPPDNRPSQWDDDENSKSEESVEGLREVYRSAMEGMFAYDKDKFLASVTGSKEAMDYADAFMEFCAAVKEFKDAAIKEWGENGWTPFTLPGGARLSLSLSGKPENIDKLVFKITGDEATATMPGDDKPNRLVRKDGRWYLLAEDLVGKADPARTTLQRKMATVIREKKKRIGQKNVNAFSLDKELGDAMSKAMKGS
jgi:hypothetical protein